MYGDGPLGPEFGDAARVYSREVRTHIHTLAWHTCTHARVHERVQHTHTHTHTHLHTLTHTYTTTTNKVKRNTKQTHARRRFGLETVLVMAKQVCVRAHTPQLNTPHSTLHKHTHTHTDGFL